MDRVRLTITQERLLRWLEYMGGTDLLEPANKGPKVASPSEHNIHGVFITNQTLMSLVRKDLISLPNVDSDTKSLGKYYGGNATLTKKGREVADSLPSFVPLGPVRMFLSNQTK